MWSCRDCRVDIFEIEEENSLLYVTAISDARACYVFALGCNIKMLICLGVFACLNTVDPETSREAGEVGVGAASRCVDGQRQLSCAFHQTMTTT